nr:MAG TPA: neurotoxin [Caudoviricetes sp.]
MICHRCRYKRNCINGSWCSCFKNYVEYKFIVLCIFYEQ